MIKHILKYGLFTACLSLVLVNLSSCKDDSSGGGAPEILEVRLTNPASADSTFAQANVGQVIAIMGKNLQGVQKVYINDQEIPYPNFNPLFNTSTSLVVTIPTEGAFALLYDKDENGNLLSSTIKEGVIKVETANGSASYAFTVMGGSPGIILIDADEYPIPTGGKVIVTGRNFVNIKRVFISNVPPDSVSLIPGGQIFEILDWDVSSDRSLDTDGKTYIVSSTLSFILPDLPRDGDGNFSGYLSIESQKTGSQTQGARAVSKFATLPNPEVDAVSSDMPLPGQTVTITGKYFINVYSINIKTGINGENTINIPVEDLTVTKTSISFVMPADKMTNPKSNPLTIVALAGSTTLTNFYPTGSVFIDFDSSDKTVDQTWGPNATYIEADGANPPYISDGLCAHITGPTADWWGTLVYWKSATGDSIHFPSYDVIPANTPTTDVYLSYDCYNTVPFSLETTGGTTVRYAFNTALGSGYPNVPNNTTSGKIWWADYQFMQGPTNPVFPGADGQQVLDSWYQVLIPLSYFGLDGMTYKDFAKAGIVEFIMQTQFNNGPQPSQQPDYFIDNVRIVMKLVAGQ